MADKCRLERRGQPSTQRPMPALVPKAVREYYAEQHVRTLDLEAVRQFQTTPAASGDTGSTRARGVQRLIQCSFAVNAVLTVSKIVVFVSSHSFAILVSLIDSFLDLVSTAVLWRIAAAAAPHSRLRLQFPVGKNTLEPIGTLIFSVVLSVAMFIAATGALTALVQGLLRPAHPVRSGPSFGTSAAVVIGVTVLANFTFGLREALVLFTLFSAQLVTTSGEARLWFAYGYVALAIGNVLRNADTRRSIIALLRPSGSVN